MANGLHGQGFTSITEVRTGRGPKASALRCRLRRCAAPDEVTSAACAAVSKQASSRRRGSVRNRAAPRGKGTAYYLHLLQNGAGF
jgi:hypothetical protein